VIEEGLQMATWVFEPGHTAADFCVRHMMVTWVRGHFKDIHGTVEFDPDNPATLSMAVEIAPQKPWENRNGTSIYGVRIFWAWRITRPSRSRVPRPSESGRAITK
jgi:hypothetical protein